MTRKAGTTLTLTSDERAILAYSLDTAKRELSDTLATMHKRNSEAYLNTRLRSALTTIGTLISRLELTP